MVHHKFLGVEHCPEHLAQAINRILGRFNIRLGVCPLPWRWVTAYGAQENFRDQFIKLWLDICRQRSSPWVVSVRRFSPGSQLSPQALFLLYQALPLSGVTLASGQIFLQGNRIILGGPLGLVGIELLHP